MPIVFPKPPTHTCTPISFHKDMRSWHHDDNGASMLANRIATARVPHNHSKRSLQHDPSRLYKNPSTAVHAAVLWVRYQPRLSYQRPSHHFILLLVRTNRTLLHPFKGSGHSRARKTRFFAQPYRSLSSPKALSDARYIKPHTHPHLRRSLSLPRRGEQQVLNLLRHCHEINFWPCGAFSTNLTFLFIRSTLAGNSEKEN